MEPPGFLTSAVYRVARGQAFPWVKPPLAKYHRWVVMATPYGSLLIQERDNGTSGSTGNETLRVGDWPDWTVVRDHTNAALYYVSGFNNILQAIKLAELEFSPACEGNEFPHFPSIALLPPPLELAWYQDATRTFHHSNVALHELSDLPVA